MTREITKREILFSTIIFLVCLAITIWGNIAILDLFQTKNEIYNKALRLETPELIQYACDTNAGNAFITTTITSDEKITHGSISGEYMSIYERKEKYTMKTRTVTRTDSKGHTSVSIETYWEWDTVSREYKNTLNVNIQNIKIPFERIKGLNYERVDQIRDGGDRWTYEAVPYTFDASAFVNFNDGTVVGDITVYRDVSIEELYKKLSSGAVGWIILLWVGFVVICSGLILLFYYFENKWLH